MGNTVPVCCSIPNGFRSDSVLNKAEVGLVPKILCSIQYSGTQELTSGFFFLAMSLRDRLLVGLFWFI